MARSTLLMIPVCALGLLSAITCGGYAQSNEVDADRRFNSVAWMQSSFEYRLLTQQTWRHALTQLKAGLSDPNWSADEVQMRDRGFAEKPPAIIVDVDETILDNSAFNARNIIAGKPFSYQTWNDWCNEEQSVAIPGAVEFIKQSEKLGVKVFYVTNREDAIKPATVNNLIKIGLDATNENVLTRNDQEQRGDDKTSRRAMIAEQHRIVLLIGDSMSDLCSGMGTRDQRERNSTAAEKSKWLGERWIMLPNPSYGSWERALPKGPAALNTRNRQHE